MNPVLFQKLRDLDVMPVFFAIPIVLNQDQRLFGGAADPVELAVRSAFLDWRNFDFVDVEPRKMEAGLAEKQVGSHESDVDVAMSSSGSFSGADNTTKQLGIGSNL